MAVTIQTEMANDLTVFTATGSTSLQELLEAMRTAWPAGPTRRSLWDLRDAPIVQSGFAATQVVLAVRASYGEQKGTRTAIVALEGTTTYGQARQYEMMAEGTPGRWIRSFTDLGVARRWLLASD